MARQQIVDPSYDKTNTEGVDTIVPFKDPFYVMLNIQNIMNPDMDHVYFYIYSTGKKNVVMWGIYDKNMGTFVIDGSCKRTPQLVKFINIWKARGITAIGDFVENRMGKRLLHYRPEIVSYDTYKIYKHIIQYMSKSVHDYDIKTIYPTLFEDMDIEIQWKYDVLPRDPKYQQYLNVYLNDMREKIQFYEDVAIHKTDYITFSNCRACVTFYATQESDITFSVPDSIKQLVLDFETQVNDLAVTLPGPNQFDTVFGEKLLLYARLEVDTDISEEIYIQYKNVLSYYSKDQDKYDFTEFYPIIHNLENNISFTYNANIGSDKYNTGLTEMIQLLRSIVDKYEQQLNSISVNRHVPIELKHQIKLITERFYDYFKSGRLFTDNKYLLMEKCPKYAECEYDPDTKNCDIIWYGDDELKQSFYSSDLAWLV